MEERHQLPDATKRDEATAPQEPPVEGLLGPSSPSPLFRHFGGLAALYFRPFRFFAGFVEKHGPSGREWSPALFLLAVWLVGTSNVIDGMEVRFSLGRRVAAIDSWSEFWPLTVVAGLIAGYFYSRLGGWWYRLRLRWSGAVESSPSFTRRVFIIVCLVEAMPSLAGTVLGTISFPSPRAALAAWSWWDYAVLPFLLWSLWTGYAAARAAFLVRRGAGIFWFLAVPVIFYLIFFSGAAAWYLMSGPITSTSLRHEANTMAFDYPSNWLLGDNDEDFDPDSKVTVEPVIEDAQIEIAIYDSEDSPEDELKATLEGYQGVLKGRKESPRFRPWGGIEGVGRTVEGTIEEEPFTLRIFVGRTRDGRTLEVKEFWNRSQEAKVLPGFEFIRGRFRLKTDVHEGGR